MTGSHPQPAPHRETGTEDANDHLATQAESRTINFDLPALNSMRPTAPPSRPYGRYAVGLRPSLDPDACFDAPSQDNEARRTNQNNTEVGLDRPRSFRNDLRKLTTRNNVKQREMTCGYAKGVDDINTRDELHEGLIHTLPPALRGYARPSDAEVHDGC
jgi:hypothetical protein